MKYGAGVNIATPGHFRLRRRTPRARINASLNLEFRMRTIALAVLAFAATVGSAAAQSSSAAATPAPQSPLTRTVLQTKPMVTVPGHDGIIVRAELAVGGTAPRHMHPGEEFVYVLDGTGTFDLAGQPTITLKPGDAFVIPANTPHVAKNTGAVPLKLLSTYIIATGKPLAIPAP
jgi:quercetin dioxygenase-like cupin family protein